MLFNSWAFLIFAASFFALWPVFRRRATSRWAFLVVASFIFYGWWDWRFLFLIVASGLIDFVAALAMSARPAQRRLWLSLSVAGNLGSLAIFKYSSFLAANVDAVLHGWGLSWRLAEHIPEFCLILPVGISFYTFQSMSYTIDVYRGELTPTRNLLHFFAYLAMFPQLVAGPIVRASALLPQLQSCPPVTESQRWSGGKLIICGYFKKVVIADHLAQGVNDAFALQTSGSCLYWWVVALMFAFQIYGDFSGYSDIACGLARWMGYDFGRNFHHPYAALSIREFWQRWHISLSTWFRDYVYIPLGGSRGGRWLSHRNMWITMLVSGLWHGAAWTFVIWGALHAAFLSCERLTGWPDRVARWRGGKLLAFPLVLAQVLIAWMFFRAESFSQAVQIVGTMLSFQSAALAGLRLDWLAFLSLGIAFETLQVQAPRLDTHRLVLGVWKRFEPLAYAALLVMCVYLRGPGGAFIYFQF